MKVKKCRHHLLYPDVNSFLVTSKCQKIQRIDGNRSCLRRKPSYLLYDVGNFNGSFRKYVTYEKIESRNKAGLLLLSVNYTLKKTTGGIKLTQTPAFLGLKRHYDIWHQFFQLSTKFTNSHKPINCPIVKKPPGKTSSYILCFT